MPVAQLSYTVNSKTSSDAFAVGEARTRFAGYRASPQDRIDLIRKGVAAATIKEIARSMDLPQDRLLTALDLSVASVNRKAKAGESLSGPDSERVIGLLTLIEQVQTMVEDSGDPEGFDAAKWLGGWFEQPVPALADQKPIDYMDTLEGQRLVSKVLSAMQSGAYL